MKSLNNMLRKPQKNDSLLQRLPCVNKPNGMRILAADDQKNTHFQCLTSVKLALGFILQPPSWFQVRSEAARPPLVVAHRWSADGTGCAHSAASTGGLKTAVWGNFGTAEAFLLGFSFYWPSVKMERRECRGC